MAAGHRRLVDPDLEKLFDRIDHDVLMSRAARRVKDERVLLLIRRYPQAGLMEGRAGVAPDGGAASGRAAVVASLKRPARRSG